LKLFNNKTTWNDLVRKNQLTGLRATAVQADQALFLDKLISQLKTMEVIKPGSTANALDVLSTCLSRITSHLSQQVEPMEFSTSTGPSFNRRP